MAAIHITQAPPSQTSNLRSDRRSPCLANQAGAPSAQSKLDAAPPEAGESGRKHKLQQSFGALRHKVTLVIRRRGRRVDTYSRESPAVERPCELKLAARPIKVVMRRSDRRVANTRWKLARRRKALHVTRHHGVNATSLSNAASFRLDRVS